MILFFEGVDGAGKTTLIQNYKDYLTKMGEKAEIIKFPQNDKIREICRGFNNSTARTLLYMADMKSWWDRPRSEDVTYLVDRFFITTQIYQVELLRHLQPCEPELFNDLKDRLFPGHQQAKIVYVKADYDTIAERLEQRASIHDEEDEEMLRNIIDLYENLHNDSWITVEGSKKPDEVLEELITLIDKERKI